MLYTCVARSIYYFIIAIRLVFFFHPLRGNARVQKSGAIWSDRTFRRGTSTSLNMEYRLLLSRTYSTLRATEVR